MEIGDSFYVADPKDADRVWKIARVRNAEGKRKYRQQRDEHGGRRIWRVA